MSYKTAKTMTEVLISHAASRPHAIMLRDEHGEVSYSAALRQVRRAGASLLRSGVILPSRVAVLCKRTKDTPLAMHAVWWTGSCAVLLDADLPDAAIQERCEAADVTCILHLDHTSLSRPLQTRGLLLETLINADHSGHDSDPDEIHETDRAAYIVFTSGSTRRAKAVVVSHANVLSYATGLLSRLGLSAERPVFGHTTTFAADLGHTSIFLPLLAGGTCAVLSSDAARDAESFWREVRSMRIDWVKTTPSHIRALIEVAPTSVEPLRGLILGGEPLRRDLAEKVFEAKICETLVNHYGPTETTIGIACFTMASPSDIPTRCASVPIGSVIGNNRLELSTHVGGPVDEGELIVRGPSVAIGYLETNETGGFVRGTGEQEGQSLYRTGDICREVAPGIFEFLGRRDRQVKVRGYSVDLGEVERALLALPEVGEAIVAPRTVDGATHLVAGVVPKIGLTTAPSADSLLRALAHRVPGYALPARLLIIDGPARTANGKLDAAALLAPAGVSSNPARELRPDESTEDCVLQLAGELFGTALRDPLTDLRQLGADSITLMRLVARLTARGLRISLKAIMDDPRPRSIANRLDKETASSATVLNSARMRTLSAAQADFFKHIPHDAQLWNQAVLLLSRQRLSLDAVFRARGELIRRHKLLAQKFNRDGKASNSQAVWTSGFGATLLPEVRVLADMAIVETATRLQRSLSFERGDVFHVHVFQGTGSVPDHLLLFAHHLVVDVLSWRTILEDLSRGIGGGASDDGILPPGDFWSFTRADPLPPALDTSPLPKPLPLKLAPVNTGDRGPRSRILSFSSAETANILGLHPSGDEVELRLFSALIDSLQTVCCAHEFSVDVERHGRPIDDSGSTYSGTVGWFTRLVRVDVPGRRHDHGATLAGGRTLEPGDSHSDVSFNYIGNLAHAIPHGSTFEFSPLLFGPLRCSSGDAERALKFSGRIVEDQLVVDFVVDSARIDEPTHRRVVEAFARHLAPADRSIGINRLAPVSTSGHIFLRAPRVGADYENRPKATVVLTGATGFVGSYLLKELLMAGCQVIALVRATNSIEARARALEGLQWTLSELTSAMSANLEAIACDISEAAPDSDEVLRAARGRPDVMIHAAADTRLFAAASELEAVNVNGTKHIIELTEALGRPLLVHVSTLSVAGRYLPSDPYTFSEDDFDIGQQFLTPYEGSKAAAEELVRNWSGTNVQIIRTGHVAADSVNGRFQRNIDANRVCQTLRSYIELGVAPIRPRETLAFSHVDTVARGIVALALTSNISGTFHVESPHHTSNSRICAELNRAGWNVRLVERDAYRRALHHAALQSTAHESIVASELWESLPERNIIFDSKWTNALLDRLGVNFVAPDARWFAKFFSHAVQRGFLPQGRPGESGSRINQRQQAVTAVSATAEA
jgi:thioester reductase-like protein